MQLTSLTPVMIVDDIGPCVPFWQALGFTLGMTVPDAAPFVFAILNHGPVELMLQTRASATADSPRIAGKVQASVLYLSVPALEPVLAALPDALVAVARQTTFYGADEIYLEDPSGNIIGFAAPKPAE